MDCQKKIFRKRKAKATTVRGKFLPEGLLEDENVFVKILDLKNFCCNKSIMKKSFLQPWIAALTVIGCSYHTANGAKVSELLEANRGKLAKTSVYVIATAWNEERFAKNFVRSMQDTQEDLAKYKADFHVYLRCDGRKEDEKAFTDEFLKAKFPEDCYQIFLNQKNEGVFHSRLALLRDIRKSVETDIAAGKEVYVIPMDSDDIWRKNGILTLVVSGLQENADYVFTNPCDVMEREIESKNRALEIKGLEVENRKEDNRTVFQAGWAFFGFNASCLYNEHFDTKMKGFEKNSDATWMFFNQAGLFKNIVFCEPKGKDGQLMLYVHHNDSSLHSPLLQKLGDFSAQAKDDPFSLICTCSLEQKKCLLEDRRLFLYQPNDALITNDQFSEYIPVKGGQNSFFTKELFIEKLSGEHRWWKALYRAVKGEDDPFFKETFSKEPLCSLIKEDSNKDLSEEKVMKYFGAFYQKITTLDPIWADPFFRNIAKLKEWMQEKDLMKARVPYEDISEFESEDLAFPKIEQEDFHELERIWFWLGVYDERVASQYKAFLIDNKKITKDMLYECLKNMHIYGNHFASFYFLTNEDRLMKKYNKGDISFQVIGKGDEKKKKNRLVSQWVQHPSEPLSKEFIEKHYKEIFQGLFGEEK